MLVAVKEQIGLRARRPRVFQATYILMRPSAQFLSNSAGRARFFSSSNICTRAGKSTGRRLSGSARLRSHTSDHDKNQEYRGT